MTFKSFFAFLVMIGRLFLGVKVFSWIILRLISDIPHPISEIEIYLVFMIVDVWGLGGQITEIIVKKEN